MADSRTYPHGVPSWIEAEQPDPGAARAFYGGLFGWAFEDRPGGYTIARLAGREVAGVLPGTGGGAARWTTYVAVDSADSAVERVVAAGGKVLREPEDATIQSQAPACSMIPLQADGPGCHAGTSTLAMAWTSLPNGLPWWKPWRRQLPVPDSC